MYWLKLQRTWTSAGVQTSQNDGLDNWQWRANGSTTRILLHRWSTEPGHVRRAIQTKKVGPRHSERYIDIPKLTHSQGQDWNPEILHSSLLGFLPYRTNLTPSSLFPSFTDNRGNERFVCCFIWSDSYPFGHLSISPSFYLGLSLRLSTCCRICTSVLWNVLVHTAAM